MNHSSSPRFPDPQLTAFRQALAVQLQPQRVSSNISRFLLFPLLEENSVLQGHLVNEQYGFYLPFTSWLEMAGSLEQLFNYCGFPQATQGQRHFAPSPLTPTLPQQLYPLPKGQLVANKAFLLHIQFRHHSSWQGTLTDLRQTPSCQWSFFSELELLRLLESALQKR